MNDSNGWLRSSNRRKTVSSKNAITDILLLIFITLTALTDTRGYTGQEPEDDPVGSVEAPVTVEDIKATIKEFWKMAGGENAAETNGIDFLVGFCV